jgi:sterol 3beta-glucosyltransferase
LGDLINTTRSKQLRLDPVSPLWGHQLLSRLHVPYTYLWSQSLIPKPADWGSHIDIAGFSFLPLGKSYTPDRDLLHFLDSGSAPLYIGFGSIVVDDPAGLTRMIYEAVQKAGVRAIVSKGWGGVGGNDNVPKSVYLIGNVPHDWLFQHVSGVVHHGGAGTTAAGIAAGLPTVVVPFFGDQPFWGSMIAKAGAGPVPVPFKEMTADTLAESIRYAMQPNVREAAQAMAAKIATEDGAASATAHVAQTMEIDDMRCDLCPERLAVFKHKRMDLHLSAFATVTLAQSRVCRGEDFKLIRHREWYVDEGPAHWVIGGVAAGAGFVHNIGASFSNYSRRLEKITAKREAIKTAQAKGSDNVPREKIAPVGINAEGEVDPVNENWSPKQLETLVKKLNSKSPSTKHFQSGEIKDQTCEERSGGVARLRATGQLGVDLGAAVLKAPVALFYNVANGFHNWPSYASSSIVVRRRDPITGFQSGCRAAGKELVYGFYDAGHGLITMPYEGARTEGIAGFGKGVFFGWGVFLNNIAAGKLSPLPSYHALYSPCANLFRC